MAQHDMVIDNASGASVRSDINNALAAIASLNSGTAAPSTPYADQLWVDTTNALVKQRNAANSASITIGRRGEAYWGLAPHGGCQLTKSGANLLLSPFRGNKLLINGALEVVPASTTLAPTSLSANTTYYIYAYMSSGTFTLEASTTAPSTGTDGVTIKTGDATRTLVGMARTIAGPAWSETTALRFVRSFFNDAGVFAGNSNGAGTFSNTSAFAETTTPGQVSILTWAGETVEVRTSVVALPAAGDTLYVGVWRDGAHVITSPGAATAATGSYVNPTASYIVEETAGLHTYSASILTQGGQIWTQLNGYGGVSVRTRGSGA